MGKHKMQAATIEVDNPRYEPGHPNEIRRISVDRALRDDPLGRMHARGQLGYTNDKAQSGTGWVRYLAGRSWQNAYEQAGIGRIKAMDSTEEPVDGSRKPTVGVTDRQMRASRQRASWRLLLGDRGFQLLDMVLIEKATLVMASNRLYYNANKAGVTYVGHRFRECLDAIAEDIGR